MSGKASRDQKSGSVDARVKKIAGVSFDQIQSALCGALKEKFPPENAEDGCVPCDGPWLRDVFDDTAVYSHKGKLYRIAYSFSGNTATLNGEPEEVVVSYVPAPAAGAAPAPAEVQANAKAARAVLAKKVDGTLAALAQKATPALRK